MPDLGPLPQEDLDRCRCPKTPKKKTTERKPRAVCYQGTYTQRAKGISYRKLREVPCAALDSGSKAGSTVRSLKSKATRAVRKKISSFITF